MNHSALLLLLSVWSQPRQAVCFVTQWLQGAALASSPELLTYVGGQTNTVLDVRLSIGLLADQLFVIDGFQFRLCNSPLSKENAKVPLPGAHGPRPNLSSGIHELRTERDGSFINMEGRHDVELRDGVWEMVWQDESPAGLVICGLSLDRDWRRNENVLERGQIYLTWPVWSKRGLEEQLARKAAAKSKYKEFEAERNNELAKMSDSPGILEKAMHFRRAAAATERMDCTGLHTLMDVPTTEDVYEIGEGLQIVRCGTVWTKTGSFRGSFRARRQKLLGSATIRN